MSVFRRDNLLAWCIVPFDAKKRGPRERAEMLRRLGLRALAYDWRDEHIPTFDEELAQLRANDIRLAAFYQIGGWPDDEAAAREAPRIRAGLDFIRRNDLRVDVWATYRGDETEGMASDEERYAAAARRVGVMANLFNELGCRLGVYNHGGWGGEPRTMIEIVQRLSSNQTGIVYNFHHGHDHLSRMPGAFNDMLPHLMCVNLNGMSLDGSKIVPLGQGEKDLEILGMIADSGYDGPIGILDHRPEVDAELSLSENLEGLRRLLGELGDAEALATHEGSAS